MYKEVIECDSCGEPCKTKGVSVSIDRNVPLSMHRSHHRRRVYRRCLVHVDLCAKCVKTSGVDKLIAKYKPLRVPRRHARR
jgi:hypothetical protein